MVSSDLSILYILGEEIHYLQRCMLHGGATTISTTYKNMLTRDSFINPNTIQQIEEPSLREEYR
ncbi:MAG TPA: hypothetical protein VHF65_00875 [Nitrososphaera sp.]|nr:hypothetical protein [Nitrososphaera sp.]